MFGRLWEWAEQHNDEGGPADYYFVGVLWTLRWLARTEHKTPVTRVTSSALPEITEAEYMAALAASRSTVLHSSRIETARGCVAVLGWLFHGQPQPYSATSARGSASARG